MNAENVKQIISYLRSTHYFSSKTYSDNYLNSPRLFYNFLLMLEGEARFQINSENVIVLKRGELIWLPKGSTFFVEWIGSSASWYVLHFDFSFSFNPFSKTKTFVQRLDYPTPLDLLPDFQALTNETNPYFTISTFYRMFGKLFPLIHTEKISELQLIIQPALNYIETHYKEKIYVKDLAAICTLSSSRFYYLFKEIVGLSPIDYKNRLLIQNLQQELLMNQNKSLDTLAIEYGFESTVYLCRLFKKITGITPTEARKNNTLM